MKSIRKWNTCDLNYIYVQKKKVQTGYTKM